MEKCSYEEKNNNKMHKFQDKQAHFTDNEQSNSLYDMIGFS